MAGDMKVSKGSEERSASATPSEDTQDSKKPLIDRALVQTAERAMNLEPSSPETERTPLLASQQQQDPNVPAAEAAAEGGDVQILEFEDGDPDDPRQWPRWRKMANVAVISCMALLGPFASSMFTPGIKQIADELHVSEAQVFGGTTTYVCALGFGPLLLAPLSETYGRRKLYTGCFSLFTLTQLALYFTPNLTWLLVIRGIGGFFGSVSVANGGGSLNDMFLPTERAAVFGWYLLGPLVGPSLGPVIGGVVVEYLGWRWVFMTTTIVCAINTTLGFIFLKETYAPAILAKRCRLAEKKYGGRFTYPHADARSMTRRLGESLSRPPRVLLTQPIVLVISIYQAIIFACTYSLVVNMQRMFSTPPYNFGSNKVGLMNIGTGIGFVLAIRLAIPRIDDIFKYLTKRNGGKAKPEFRLPLANVGAILMPLSLLWFGLAREKEAHWLLVVAATVPFSFGQICVFNSVQNYYIDTYSRYAASAIAAATVFRSVLGGIAPRFSPYIFDSLGWGWGWGVYVIGLVLLAPSPLLFMKYGERIRMANPLNWSEI